MSHLFRPGNNPKMTARVQTVRSRSRSRSPEAAEEPVKLHVSNLPLTFPQQQLSEIFSKFGAVQDVRIIRKGSNGQPLKETCYGFVVLGTREAANRAMKELNNTGMSVSLSRESRLKTPVVAPVLTPSLIALQENAQLTWCMLTHNFTNMDQKRIQELVHNNHSNAYHLSDVPANFEMTLLSRELWVGNISPVTDKRLLYEAFKGFGSIESIEMFSSKGFAFVKFRKVTCATVAFERHRGLMVDGRPVKVTFGDPNRRYDMLGDCRTPEDPNFNPSDDNNFKSLYIGYSSGRTIPSEHRLVEIFNRYGRVKSVHIKRVHQPYAFIDFETGEEAARCRRELYLDDKDGMKRGELGDPALEVSFKNTTNVKRPVQKTDALELAKRLVESPNIIMTLESKAAPSFSYPAWPYSYPPPGTSFPVPVPVDVPVVSHTPSPPPVPVAPAVPVSPRGGDVVWSGFMSRTTKSRVGVDAYLLQGSEDLLPPNLHHLNITHRVPFSEVGKTKVLALMALEASNSTQESSFREYLKYFTDKQRAGYVLLKGAAVYLLPPGEEALKFTTHLGDTQLLAIFADLSQKVDRPPLHDLIKTVATHPALVKQLNVGR